MANNYNRSTQISRPVKARALIYFTILSVAYKHYTWNKNTSIFQPQKPHILNIWLIQDCQATYYKYLLQSGPSPAHACLLKLEDGANTTPETSYFQITRRWEMPRNLAIPRAIQTLLGRHVLFSQSPYTSDRINSSLYHVSKGKISTIKRA